MCTPYPFLGKIAIIDDENCDGGIKYLFPEADYYIYQARDGVDGFFERNGFERLTQIENITDKNYSTLFVIKPLYNTVKQYQKMKDGASYENTNYIERMDKYFDRTIDIINKNNFKYICFFVNCDYDMDPNFIFRYKNLKRENILFFKRNYSRTISYESNVFSFPYVIFFRNNYNVIESLCTIPVLPPPIPQHNRLFFSGSIYFHTDHNYGVYRNRRSMIQKIHQKMPHMLYIANNLSHEEYMRQMGDSKFCLDLLGCGDPNLRTFEILTSGSLLISERSTLVWNFKAEFCEETVFDDENDLAVKLQKLTSDDALYKKCLVKQQYIVRRYMNKQSLRDYISETMLVKWGAPQPLKLYVYGFWSGFFEKENPVNIVFFLNLFEMVFGIGVEVGNTIEECDLLLETVFANDTKLFQKKWKYSFLFSGESTINRPLKNREYYSCVLCGQRNNNNIVNLPLYIPYLYNNDHLYVKMVNMTGNTCVPYKNVCAILSNRDGTFRNHFLRKLEDVMLIDYAGEYKNNVPRITAPYHTEEFRQFVSQYKFIVTMENTGEDTYITEKITHGFLTNTIPIYWGSPQVENYFNPDRFIRVGSLDDIDRAIQQIKTLCSNNAKYLEMTQQPIFPGNTDPRPLNAVVNDIKNLIFPNKLPQLAKIYLVNSPDFEPESYERLRKMFIEQYKLSEEKLQFISPTYKHTITDEMMKKHVTNDLMIKTFRKKSMKKSELSLILNYKAILEHIVKNYKTGIFLILESDVFMTKNMAHFSDYIDYVKNIRCRWDLIHIGYDGGDAKDGIFNSPHFVNDTPYRKHKLLSRPFIEDITIPEDSIRLIRKYHTRCTDSFIWNYSGIVKFLQHMNTDTNYGAAFDYYMTNFFEKNEEFKHYWSNVQFFIQGSNHGMVKSTIQGD